MESSNCDLECLKIRKVEVNTQCKNLLEACNKWDWKPRYAYEVAEARIVLKTLYQKAVDIQLEIEKAEPYSMELARELQKARKLL